MRITLVNTCHSEEYLAHSEHSVLSRDRMLVLFEKEKVDNVILISKYLQTLSLSPIINPTFYFTKKVAYLV